MITEADQQQTANHHGAPALGELDAAQRAALAGEFVATIETLTARGLHDQADALARQMIGLLPAEGFGWKTLAYGFLRRGDLTGAYEPLRRSAALLPADAELARHLHAATAMHEALALDQPGRYAEAGKLYQTVLQTYPKHPEANHRLGVVALHLGQPEAAVPLFEGALGVNPDNGQYWLAYVNALLQSGQLKAAWLALEMGQQRGLSGPAADSLISLMSTLSSDSDARLLRLRPFVAANQQRAAAQQANQKPGSTLPAKAGAKPAHGPVAEAPSHQLEAVAALYNAKRFSEAEAGARKLIEAFPQHPFGWKALGTSLYNLGRYAEALEPMLKARELSPRDSQVLHICSTVLEGMGKHDEAERACRQFLEVSPDNPEALRILSIILMSLRRLDEAEQACLQASRAMPDAVVMPTTLGTVYMKQGRLAEASAQYRRAIELDPTSDLNWSNLLFCQTHSEEVDPASLFAEHCRFGQHFETPLKPHWPQHANSKQPERPLRIGFISGDFRRHAVTSFLEPVLQHLARDAGLSLYAYSNTPTSDEVTQRLRGHFAGWHNICKTSPELVTRLIRDDAIDILIDLAGHTAENRLVVMAYKPAPIQASWIGYPGTTGLSAVDYFMADRFWVPSEQYSRQFTEKIVRLPALAPFLPERNAPPVNLLPALRNGYVTFGSFNRLDKLRRDVVALWSQLLRALPASRMLIGAMAADGSDTERLAGWFAEEGIARDRLEFRQRGSVPVFLQQHHHVDICLDTLPFGGLTTALQSLWMGVPTLTLPGQTVPGRSGATAMGHAGLDAFIATDAQDYVRRGLAAAADLPALAALRAGMRERCMDSPMFRPEMIAAGVSEALRVMWRRWCDGLPAEAFDVSLDEGQAANPDQHRNGPIAQPPRQQIDAAVALFNSGRFGEAEPAARKLAEHFPHHAMGWKLLGVSLYRLGRYDDALTPLLTARELDPRDVDALQVCAAILEAKGRHEEAEQACRELLDVAPRHAEGLRILGIVLMSMGKIDEAEQVCLQAVEAAPNSALPPNTLGLLYMRQGQLTEAAGWFQRSLELGPGGDQTRSNLLLCLTHSEEVDPASLFAEHCRFGQHFETPLKPHWPQHANPKQPERPLRIGFISGDFRRHAVASFFEPVLQHLARDAGLSLYAYSNASRADEVTQRLRGHFAVWQDVYGSADESVTQRILADGIDILIDLAGHTANNRLLAMAHKPAPIQASWIGYPGTTGLSAVDYFMADRFWVPSEQYSRQFTEKIVRLPALAPFLPEQSAPPVSLLPALRNGYVTFGSFNRINKLRRDVIALWSQLLRALPASRMLIGAMPVDGSGTERLAGWFAEEGIARERLEFRQRGSVPVFLQQHHHVDLCLDTLPFGGLTTALQSLWMGVPTLTLPGQTVPGRSGATAMGHAGLDAFIATDAQDYVRRGLAAAADLPALAALRVGMRERCMDSPMFRPETIAAGVSEALRVMWRRWCDGLPAEAFDVP